MLASALSAELLPLTRAAGERPRPRATRLPHALHLAQQQDQPRLVQHDHHTQPPTCLPSLLRVRTAFSSLMSPHAHLSALPPQSNGQFLKLLD